MGREEWALLALHVGAMLACAMAAGQLFRSLRMPAVVGEILVGALLGPTLLGRISPEAMNLLFPATGDVAEARTAMMRVGMLFFIVTIGLDISVNEFFRLGRKALLVGSIGTFVPLGLGYAIAYWFPGVIGVSPQNQNDVALFLAAIVALSANPIIARILMDLGIFRSEVGKVIMSATLVDDLVGWSLFAVLLAGTKPGVDPNAKWGVLGWVGLFFVVVLVAGRYLLPRILDFVDKHWPRPWGTISAIIVFALFGAAGSEHLGLHSFLGAFLVGIALADTYNKHKEAFVTILNFSAAVITPVFFLSMGIGVDFVAGFDLLMVLLVSVTAFVGKVFGVFIGGRLAGLGNRDALAVGAGMNARGIIGIVMAAVAYESGIIELKLYVACMVMCMLTTLAAGPALRLILGPRYRSLADQSAQAEAT